jgi:hypothetical protein
VVCNSETEGEKSKREYTSNPADVFLGTRQTMCCAVTCVEVAVTSATPDDPDTNQFFWKEGPGSGT